MTMILGVNLSDRFYLSGDTRLSYRDSDGDLCVRHDNMQKVEYLAGTGVNQTLVAMAGDVSFANHIVKLLRKEQFAREGVASIRNSVEDWLRPVVDAYFTQNGFTNATFIIGGANSNAKKVVNGSTWRELANAYTGGKGPVMVRNGLHEIIKPGEKIPDGDVELGINDTVLFAVSVSQEKGIEITDTKWGEVLLYGQSAGVIREEITPKEIGELEFGVNPTGHSQSDQANAITIAMMRTLARKHNLETVGGAVLTMEHEHNGTTSIITGTGMMYSIKELEKLKPGESLEPMEINQIAIENNRFYRVENGTRHRLIPVSGYQATDSTQLFL